MCTLLPWIPPGGAAVSAAPTEQAVKKLPQMSTELTEPLAEKSLPQMARMRTDVGGYGIPAIPTLPTQGVQLSPLGFAACQSKNCTNKTSGEEAPTECTEYTEPLAEKSLPQMARMRTDVGGYGIPAIPTLPNSVYSVNSVGEQRTLSICVNL